MTLVFIHVEENSKANQRDTHDPSWQDQEDTTSKFVDDEDSNTGG